MLLDMKMQILEQAQLQLCYLGGIIIFPQAASGRIGEIPAIRLLPEVVYNNCHLIYDRKFYQFALNLILSPQSMLLLWHDTSRNEPQNANYMFGCPAVPDVNL